MSWTEEKKMLLSLNLREASAALDWFCEAANIAWSQQFHQKSNIMLHKGSRKCIFLELFKSPSTTSVDQS